jgi:hypothetical protein
VRDVVAERYRQRPRITQPQLAAALGWDIHVLVAIETEAISVTQGQLREMMEAVKRVVAERAKGERDAGSVR